MRDTVAIREVDAEATGSTLLAFFEAHRFAGIRNARRALAQGPCQMWLAEEASTLVGLLLCAERACDDGKLRGVPENCLIAPAHRRQGVARRLLEAAEHHYRSRGLAGMELAVRADFELNEALAGQGYTVVRSYVRDKLDWDGRVIPNQARLLLRRDFDSVDQSSS